MDERKVVQMVRVKDYDVQTNRWVIEPIWPAPAGQPVQGVPTAGTDATTRGATPARRTPRKLRWCRARAARTERRRAAARQRRTQ